MSEKLSKNIPSICIIGAGRLGASLAYYFWQNEIPVTALIESDPSRFKYLKTNFGFPFLHNEPNETLISEADIIQISVKDSQIESLATHLAANYPCNWPDKIIAHNSGVLPAGVLNTLKEKGARIAAIHPIYSFADNPEKNHHLRNAWFDLEGDAAAVRKFKILFEKTGNYAIELTPEQKKALHVSSVTYANFYVSLAYMSHYFMKDFSQSEQNSFQILNPLIYSAIEQVSEKGTFSGLTGPVKRGDQNSIEQHLEFLSKQPENLSAAYISLTKILLDVCKTDDKSAAEINSLLNNYQKKLKSDC